MEPLRKLIRKIHGAKGGVEFLESECIDIDPQAKTVHCEDRSGIVGAVSKVNVSVLGCVPFSEFTVYVAVDTATITSHHIYDYLFTCRESIPMKWNMYTTKIM